MTQCGLSGHELPSGRFYPYEMKVMNESYIKLSVYSRVTIGMMLTLMIFGTLISTLRLSGVKSPRSGILSILVCFSVPLNFGKWSKSEKGIGCLHGLRVLSASYVVLYHTFTFRSDSELNPIDIKDVQVC